jgi:DNA-directed RNA polymerase beta subunit
VLLLLFPSADAPHKIRDEAELAQTPASLVKTYLYVDAVSVFVLMRALGLETDKEIIKYIMYNDNDIDMLNLLKISIDLSKKEGKKLILTKEDAYYSLTNKLRVVKKYADKLGYKLKRDEDSSSVIYYLVRSR